VNSICQGEVDTERRKSGVFDAGCAALIGPQVKAETVDAGKRILAPGVERIERALDDGWLQGCATLIEGKGHRA